MGRAPADYYERRGGGRRVVFKSVGDILISVGGNFSLTLVKHFTLCERTTLQ